MRSTLKVPDGHFLNNEIKYIISTIKAVVGILILKIRVTSLFSPIKLVTYGFVRWAQNGY